MIKRADVNSFAEALKRLANTRGGLDGYAEQLYAWYAESIDQSLSAATHDERLLNAGRALKIEEIMTADYEDADE